MLIKDDPGAEQLILAPGEPQDSGKDGDVGAPPNNRAFVVEPLYHHLPHASSGTPGSASDRSSHTGVSLSDSGAPQLCSSEMIGTWIFPEIPLSKY